MTIGYIGDVATAVIGTCAIDPSTGILEDITTGAPCESIATATPTSLVGLASSMSILLPIGLLVVFAVMGARK